MIVRAALIVPGARVPQRDAQSCDSSPSASVNRRRLRGQTRYERGDRAPRIAHVGGQRNKNRARTGNRRDVTDVSCGSNQR